MRLFKKKTKIKPRYIKYLSNVIQRDTMGYPLRLCMLSDNTHIWIDTYDEYVDDSDTELVWEVCDIPFGNIVFPIRQGVMKNESNIPFNRQRKITCNHNAFRKK